MTGNVKSKPVLSPSTPLRIKTANQIGLTIPQSVLYRADKVIK
jgi:hypothetical protein